MAAAWRTGPAQPDTRDLKRTIRGRPETAGQALGRETCLLRTLPAERFDTGEHAHPRVASKALATVRQTSSRCRSHWPGYRWPPGSLPGRSSSPMTGREVTRSALFRLAVRRDEVLIDPADGLKLSTTRPN
jgi:hypothetical protein